MVKLFVLQLIHSGYVDIIIVFFLRDVSSNKMGPLHNKYLHSFGRWVNILLISSLTTRLLSDIDGVKTSFCSN